MPFIISIIIWVQLNIANPVLYTWLTVASEVCGIFRAYPHMYVCKVCIDVVREMQKIYIINK